MAKSNSTAAPEAERKLSKENLGRIASEVGQVASLIYTALYLARNTDAQEAAAIEALCEKAGSMADQCACALGDVGVCGSWEKWTEAHHGN